MKGALYIYFFVAFVSAAQTRFRLVSNDGTQLCTMQSTVFDVTRDRLMEWCIDDIHCARLYHQHAIPNATLFSFFAHQTMKKRGNDLYAPLREIFCVNEQGVTLDELSQKIWVPVMKSEVNENQLLCGGANQRAMLNPDTMGMVCSCAEDADCTTDTSNLTTIYIFFSLMMAALGMIILCEFIAIGKWMRLFNKELEPLLKTSVAPARRVAIRSAKGTEVFYNAFPK